MRARPLDYAAIVLVGALVAASAAAVYHPGAGRPVVLVESPGGRQYLPLERDARLQVSGPLGVTGVEVREGRVHIDQSPCESKQCVHMGWVGPEVGWVACLPNRVFVRVQKGAVGGVVRIRTGPEEGGADARIQ